MEQGRRGAPGVTEVGRPVLKLTRRELKTVTAHIVGEGILNGR
jgi:hypothetical protein